MNQRVMLGAALIAMFALGFGTAVVIWLTVGDGAWRSTVRVDEAWFDPATDELTFLVQSCNGSPRALVVRGDDLLEVTVKAFSTVTGGEDCQDHVTVGLPLDERGPKAPSAVLDRHSGNVVDVRAIESRPLTSP